MSEDELLLVAKLRALEPTQDGRVIRALLDLLATERRRVDVTADNRPPCACAAKAAFPHQHAAMCPARLTYAAHADASLHEWRRANALGAALRDLWDAVAAEVAVHPGMHDRVAAAFRDAREVLSQHESSSFPGDDGLPFDHAEARY